MESPKGTVEIAKYYIEDRVQDIFTGTVSYSSKATPANVTMSLQGAPEVSDLTKSGMKFSFTSLVNYSLGHQDGTLEVTFNTNRKNKKFYSRKESGEYITLDENGKYQVNSDTQDYGALAPLLKEVDGKLTNIGANGVPMSIVCNGASRIVASNGAAQKFEITDNENGTHTAKLDTKNIPIYVTAADTPEMHKNQIADIVRKNKNQIP